jgi:hypothetical protein
MGLKNKAAVAVTGALTAGAFVTLAGALPAGAATYGTEQSGAGSVFGVSAHSAIVGSSTHGQNIAFTRSVQGRTVEFKTGRNGCVTGISGGSLSVENCNGGAAQKFTEVGWGSSVALQNQASHDYVQDNGAGRPVTTVRVRPNRRGQVNFTKAQLWKWIEVNPGRGNGGGRGAGHKPPRPPRQVTASASTRITDDGDTGHGTPAIWADLSSTRDASIKLTGSANSSNCGNVSPCYAYTGTLSDVNGTLTTVPGAGAPNQSGSYQSSKEAARPAHGTYHGTATITFYASSNKPKGSYVVHSHNYGGQHDSSGPYSVTDWVEQFFPAGTNFGAGPSVPSYDYVYTAGHQVWVDSSTNNDGNDPSDGNITG